jgi:hypothetical protein
MKTHVLLLLLPFVLLTSGCVILPIPLVETKSGEVWRETGRYGADSKLLSIVEEVHTLYLPIVASPEGPSKIPREKSRYTYFFSYGENYSSEHQKIAELSWLELNDCSTDFDDWNKFIRLEGTPYWIAFRSVDYLAEVKGTKDDDHLPIKYEIAVFDSRSLKDKRVITAVDWPSRAASEEEYLAALKYDRSKQSIEYNSGDGVKRYRILESVEESVSKSQK